MVPPAPLGARWELSAADAVAHGLPALGFAFEEAPRALIATRFPAHGAYAVFSGPPGTPLGILVEADGLSGQDVQTLRDALRTSPTTRIGSPRDLGEAEAVRFGTEARSAVALLAGTGAARTHYCVVMVPSPEGFTRGLLVWLYAAGRGVRSPSCAQVLSQPVLAAAAAHFRLSAP